jgi:hypothetical protein
VGNGSSGQWFIGKAVKGGDSGESGAPGGTQLAFIVGERTRPAPWDGWYVSTLPSGNGGYTVDAQMVMRPLLADNGAVLPAHEVADERTCAEWIGIGEGTRREAERTLRRYARVPRPLDRHSSAVVERCRNRLRQAGEVSQSFGDAEGWAAALRLQAECCSLLGKDRLVGALKLRARGVSEAAAGPATLSVEQFARAQRLPSVVALPPLASNAHAPAQQQQQQQQQPLLQKHGQRPSTAPDSPSLLIESGNQAQPRPQTAEAGLVGGGANIADTLSLCDDRMVAPHMRQRPLTAGNFVGSSKSIGRVVTADPQRRRRNTRVGRRGSAHQRPSTARAYLSMQPGILS